MVNGVSNKIAGSRLTLLNKLRSNNNMPVTLRPRHEVLSGEVTNNTISQLRSNNNKQATLEL